MTENVTTLSTEDTADKAYEIFKTKNFHHIPLIGRDGLLAGIISQTDFERISYGLSLFRNDALADHNLTLYSTLRLKDIMTKDVVSLDENDSTDKAVEIFRENKFHAIPIMNCGKVTGIVSMYDLLIKTYDASFQNK